MAYNVQAEDIVDLDHIGANSIVHTLDQEGLPGNLMIRATGVGEHGERLFTSGFDHCSFGSWQ